MGFKGSTSVSIASSVGPSLLGGARRRTLLRLGNTASAPITVDKEEQVPNSISEDELEGCEAMPELVDDETDEEEDEDYTGGEEDESSKSDEDQFLVPESKKPRGSYTNWFTKELWPPIEEAMKIHTSTAPASLSPTCGVSTKLRGWSMGAVLTTHLQGARWTLGFISSQLTPGRSASGQMSRKWWTD
jgi:hypothetical protein